MIAQIYHPTGRFVIEGEHFELRTAKQIGLVASQDSRCKERYFIEFANAPDILVEGNYTTLPLDLITLSLFQDGPYSSGFMVLVIKGDKGHRHIIFNTDLYFISESGKCVDHIYPPRIFEKEKSQGSVPDNIVYAALRSTSVEYAG